MEHVHQSMPATRVERRITRLNILQHKRVTQLGPNLFCLVIILCPSILPQLTSSAASPSDELQAKDIQYYYAVRHTWGPSNGDITSLSLDLRHRRYKSVTSASPLHRKLGQA
jgi:hypothetical protein